MMFFPDPSAESRLDEAVVPSHRVVCCGVAGVGMHPGEHRRPALISACAFTIPSTTQANDGVVDVRLLDLDDTRCLGRLLDLGRLRYESAAVVAN